MSAATTPTSSKSKRGLEQICKSIVTEFATKLDTATVLYTAYKNITVTRPAVTVTRTASAAATQTVYKPAVVCQAYNALTDVTTGCLSSGQTPFCAIHEGNGISGTCQTCVPLNNVCITSSQCCGGFYCSPHDSLSYGYCRPHGNSTMANVGKRAGPVPRTVATSAAAATPSATTNPLKYCSVEEVSDTIGNTWLYSEYYSGSGYVASASNVGNNALPSFPPLKTTFPGSLTDCQAVVACAQTAVEAPDNYWSFDLHYLTTSGQWECVQYINGNEDVSAFSVKNTAVSKAYGFSVQGV